MKKVVLKLDLHDDKGKRKAMKSVSGLSGIDSISMDMKDKKLTVVGDVDPVEVVSKLRKSGWYTEIVSVGPVKDEKKKDEDKKEEELVTRYYRLKNEGGNTNDQDKRKIQEKLVAELLRAYKDYNPYTTHTTRILGCSGENLAAD